MGVWLNIKSTLKQITSSRDLFVAYFGGEKSESGVSVTPETATRLSDVYSCVNVLAQTVAQTPCIVYERLDRGKQRAPQHWLYRLLHDQPNGFQTAFEFWEMLVWCLCLRGNFYALKVGNTAKPTELIPLHPDMVEIKIGEKVGDFSYVYTPQGKAPLPPYKQEEIYHVRLYADDGITGKSVIAHNRETLGFGLALQGFESRLFRRGARPSGLLSTDRSVKESEMKNVADSFSGAHSGEQSGGTAILDGGWKWQQMAISPVDAQYIEARKLNRSEIGGIFRVPAHMINDLDRATFSNIEHQDLGFVKHSMMPWFRRIEQAAWRDLLPKSEQDKYFVEFLPEALLRGDAKSQAESFHYAISDGYMNRNEVREIKNMTAAEGLDEFLQPLNMAQVGQADAATDSGALKGLAALLMRASAVMDAQSQKGDSNAA